MSNPVKKYQTLYAKTLRLQTEFTSLPYNGYNSPGLQGKNSTYGHAIINICGNGSPSFYSGYATQYGYLSVLCDNSGNIIDGSLSSAIAFLDQTNATANSVQNSEWFLQEKTKLQALCAKLQLSYTGPQTISGIFVNIENA